MKIQNYTYDKYLSNNKTLNQQQSFKAESQVKEAQSSLPTNNIIGTSLINSDLPVSYTKLGEFSIPGLKEKASVFKLSNGQKVVIAPKDGPTVIKTAYNVGSINEPDEIRGISHFIEHNLFNGSKNLAPREYTERIASLGAGTNADTSFATTNYYLDLQLIDENSLEEAIKLNSLLTQFPTFPTEQVEKEKGPVKSEIDMYKDIPSDVTKSQVLKDLFNIKTNSTDFVIGTKDNINALTRETILDYYNTWYTPDNAVTVITGDVDTEETMKLVSKYYNKKNDYSHINKRYTEPIQYNNQAQRKDIIMPNATSAHISMGFAIPEGTTKADLDKLDLLFALLSTSDSSLLRSLDATNSNISVEEPKIQNKPNGAKAKLIEVDTPEENVEEVLKILYEEITYIANNPPSAEKLEKIKQKQINMISSYSENSQMLNDVISTMALENNFNYWEDTIANIKSITPEDISAIARKILDLNKTAICISHAKTATASSILDSYNTSQTSSKIISFKSYEPTTNMQTSMPKYSGNDKQLVPETPHNLKKTTKTPSEKLIEKRSQVKEFRLNNNIETTIIPGNSVSRPLFMMEFNTDNLNSVSRSSLDVLTRLLNRGSAYRNIQEYNSIKTNKDFNFEINAGIDGIIVSGDFDEKGLSDALSLIKETLMSPNFTQEEFKQAKDYIKNIILSEEPNASDNLFREIFPNIKQYASQEQRLQELEALTLEDIKNLYSQIMSDSQVHASLIADIEQKPYLQDTFNNELSIGMGTYKPYSLQKTSSYNIYQPNTEPKILKKADERIQAEVVSAYTYPKTENIDDIAKIKALNTILGGSMSSRLFKRLREQDKLAYFTNSYTISNKNAGAILLNIETSTDPSNTQEGSPENITKALNGFNEIVNDLKSKNVSEEELQNAKAKLKTEILDRLEANADRIDFYGNKKDSFYGIKYNEELFKAIDRLTVDDIRAAANYVFKNPPVTSIVASQKTFDELNI